MYDFRNCQARFNPPVPARKRAHANGVSLASPRADSSPQPPSPTDKEVALPGRSLTPTTPARCSLKYAALDSDMDFFFTAKSLTVIFCNFIGSYLSWSKRTSKPGVLGGYFCYTRTASPSRSKPLERLQLLAPQR